MTTANKLTLLRILAIPLFLTLFNFRPGLESGDYFKVAGTVIFILAAITDFFDGAYARANAEVTLLGKFMDPIADKILITTGLISLIEFRELTNLTGWMVIIILSREFMVSALRSIAIANGRVIPANSFGKWKVAAQLTAIISGLVFLSAVVVMKSFHLAEAASRFYPYFPALLWGMNIFMVIMTLLSAIPYFVANKDLFSSSAAVARNSQEHFTA